MTSAHLHLIFKSGTFTHQFSFFSLSPTYHPSLALHKFLSLAGHCRWWPVLTFLCTLLFISSVSCVVSSILLIIGVCVVSIYTTTILRPFSIFIDQTTSTAYPVLYMPHLRPSYATKVWDNWTFLATHFSLLSFSLSPICQGFHANESWNRRVLLSFLEGATWTLQLDNWLINRHPREHLFPPSLSLFSYSITIRLLLLVVQSSNTTPLLSCSKYKHQYK